MPLDRSRLVKCLQMTASPNDNEALAAIRMANKLMTEAGVGWTGLISGSRVKVNVAGTPPSWMRPAPTKNIPEAMEFLEMCGEMEVGSDFSRMRIYWQRRKSLSPEDQKKLFDRVYDLQKDQDNQRDIPEA